ncbi:uncharacterized protein LOC121884387 [Thunnus maccoyii]|uniref:uncharacterized protein LOC121884387 n=1 Tax=Thunnus maccoyii TaxID=8240 RepID=UPI001C4D7399|nr:uncharacterized protein LOC121884387 [Thunnus maccoyii]XP_042249119.1 uncharacterized protein LOC121884387 [Thunnus maccoyii]
MGSSRLSPTIAPCSITTKGHSPSSCLQLWMQNTASRSSMLVGMAGIVTVAPGTYSRFSEGLIYGTLDFSEDAEIPRAEHCGRMLFVLVGDEAFPLCRHLFCPFPGSNITKKDSIYNYGLSCARLADSKWSFRILSSLSQMYRRVIEVGPDKVEHYVKATCVLHSVFLRESAMRDNHRAATQQLAVQPPALCDVCRTSHNNATREALKEVYSLDAAFVLNMVLPEHLSTHHLVG